MQVIYRKIISSNVQFEAFYFQTGYLQFNESLCDGDVKERNDFATERNGAVGSLPGIGTTWSLLGRS
jgi:hypothetical protein